MSKAKEILESITVESIKIKALGLYLGGAITESKVNKGVFNHQLSLLPSDRDRKGGVISLKHDKKLNLEENTIYYIEAEAKSERPDNHFGVSIYWLSGLRKITAISKLDEIEVGNG